jgi:uncharacterized membrane protein AbrB (regulator of aidB expression)
MKTLSNQTIQLIGGFLLGMIALGLVGSLALLELDIPEVLDRALYVILGSFLGVNAVNGVRRVNGKQ